MRPRPLQPLFLLVALACQAFAQNELPAGLPSKWSGEVVGVSDGDTVTVLWVKGRERHPVRIRLHGVDCPESGQPYGEQARRFTSDSVGRKTVDVERKDVDRYGRLVAVVRYKSGGKTVSLNEELVRAGMAWWYEYYAKDDRTLKSLQEEARKARRGLWKDANPVPPWEFRKG